MQYVIIGNSITSVGCIESIRKHDSQGSITVIGEENHPIYARPLISYLLQGKTDEQKMTYRFRKKSGED
jgi:NAD(P)H-nitrite reductase large subunit